MNFRSTIQTLTKQLVRKKLKFERKNDGKLFFVFFLFEQVVRWSSQDRKDHLIQEASCDSRRTLEVRTKVSALEEALMWLLLNIDQE